MDFLKRLFLSAALTGIVTPLIGHAAEPAMTPTAPESKMIAYMKDHGVDHFMMLNKQRGQILYIVNNKITDFDAALSGKESGDRMKKNFGVTPSGIFKLEALGDSDYIGFKKVKGTDNSYTNYYSIHPVLDIAGQRRKERLESMRPEWQRISSGCVNVDPDAIPGIRGMMTVQQTFKDDKSARQVTGSFFVVLPERKPVESIYGYPEVASP